MPRADLRLPGWGPGTALEKGVGETLPAELAPEASCPQTSLTKQVLGTHLGHTVRPAQAATAGEGLVRVGPMPHPSLGTTGG